MIDTVARRYLTVAIAVALAATVHAQRGAPPAGGRQGGGPPPTPRAAALTDLTGYWVSLVTEDWRYRQFTPPKGDSGTEIAKLLMPIMPASSCSPTRFTRRESRVKAKAASP